MILQQLMDQQSAQETMRQLAELRAKAAEELYQREIEMQVCGRVWTVGKAVNASPTLS